MFVTGRLPLLVAVGVVPVVLLSAAGAPSWTVALGWLALCAALVAIDVGVAPRPSSLTVTRTLPRRVRRDADAVSTLRVAVAGPRGVRALIRDLWTPTAGAGPARARVDIPAGEARTVTMPVHPRRRGELRTAGVAVRTSGPLGLAGRQGIVDAPGAIRVLPPFRSRRHLPSRLARLREMDGNTSVHMRGQGTEFDSLREYVRGDDVRSIDWRATARAGSTMLRVWRPERDRHVVIVLDTGRTSAVRVDDGVRLDAAMEAALLLSAVAAAAGDHVHVVLFDRTVRARVTKVDGAALLPALVDAMAPVEPQLIDTDWDAAFAQARAVTTHPALVVILTAQDEPEAARSFLGSLPALAARTRVLVASAHEDTAAVAPREAADVYRAAAVERAVRDVHDVSAAARRAGAEVCTASGENLPPAVADHYLALKRSGRL